MSEKDINVSRTLPPAWFVKLLTGGHVLRHPNAHLNGAVLENWLIDYLNPL